MCESFSYKVKISHLRTVGTVPVLIGCCEELVLMTTLSDQLRFLVEEENVTSGQDAEFLRQTQVAAGRGFPVCICPLDDAPIDLIVGVAVFQVPDVF